MKIASTLFVHARATAVETAISARHTSYAQSYAVRQGFERSGIIIAHCKKPAIQQRAVQHLAVIR